MTQYKSRILSTRPLDPSLIAEAAGQGILLESLSFIETYPAVDEPAGGKIAELARASIMAVFTSMNAVAAVAKCLGAEAGGSEGRKQAASNDARRGFLTLPWKIYCIGSATRERVIENFGENSIAGIADSAKELANVIIGQGDMQEIVFFCGDHRRDELPDRLREEGIRVQELVVYQTRPTPHAISAVYDGIVFFSPSAVNSFFAVNTLPAATRLFAIGRTTADAIGGYSGNPVIVSDVPGKNALIRQVIDHFQTKHTRR